MAQKPDTLADACLYRAGVGFLGGLAGAMVAMLVEIAWVVWAHQSLSAGRIAAGAVSGACIAAFSPEVLLHGIPVLAYFLLGLIGVCAGGANPHPGVELSASRWLIAAMMGGAVYGFVLLLW